MVSDLFRYRRYIFQNAMRDIRHRYAGTGLGLFWHVISPFLQILIYWLVFASIMKVPDGKDGQHHSFAIYLCAGMLPWVSFSEAISRGTGSFQENASYLKRLPIPGHIFVATAAATATLQLGISLLILIIFSLSLGLQPTWTWALLPVVCALLQVMGFGIGLILATLNIFFRDVAQFLIVFLMIWMWSIPLVYPDPILYPDDMPVPGAFRRLLPWNPPYPFFRSIHDLFLRGVLPPAWVWPVMLMWIVLFVSVGLLMFRGLQSEVRDVL